MPICAHAVAAFRCQTGRSSIASAAMPRPNFGLVIGAAISLAGIAGYALIIANDDKHQVRIVKPLAEYRCSDDCTRDGGYSWAESEGVENAEDCPDSSSAFWQGCVARARDAKSAIPFNG